MSLTTVPSHLATFTADGSGAIIRELKDKLADVVSVKDFGAVGDGVTDDTAAIQAAIDHIKQRGLCLHVPAGEYLTGPIGIGDASSFFSMIGDGPGATKFTHINGEGTLFNGGNSASGLLLEGFSVDCKHSEYAHANANHGIAIYNTNGAIIRDVHVSDYKNAAILIYGTEPLTYFDCIVENCTSDGLGAANNGMLFAEMSRSGFINCRAINVGKSGSPCYGLQLKNVCRDCYIINGYVSGASVGIAAGNYDLISGDNDRNRILGCGVYDCTTGLALGRAKGNIIIGLDVDMNNQGQNAVDFNSGSVGNVVRGVIVRNLASGKQAARFRDGDTDNICDIDRVDNSSGLAGVRVVFESASLRNYCSIGLFSNPTNVASTSSLVNDLSSGSTNVFEYKFLPNTQTATINSDGITLLHGRISRVLIDTEAAAATDNLSTITGGVDGQTILLSQVNNLRDITIKHGVGNIRLNGATDFPLTSIYQTLTLTYRSDIPAWIETARGTAS